RFRPRVLKRHSWRSRVVASVLHQVFKGIPREAKAVRMGDLGPRNGEETWHGPHESLILQHEPALFGQVGWRAIATQIRRDERHQFARDLVEVERQDLIRADA